MLPSFLGQVCDIVSQYEVICSKCFSFSSFSAGYTCLLLQFRDVTVIVCNNSHSTLKHVGMLNVLMRKCDLISVLGEIWRNGEARNEAVSRVQYGMLLNLIAGNKGEGEFWMYNFTNHKFRVLVSWDFMYYNTAWRIFPSLLLHVPKM